MEGIESTKIPTNRNHILSRSVSFNSQEYLEFVSGLLAFKYVLYCSLFPRYVLFIVYIVLPVSYPRYFDLLSYNDRTDDFRRLKFYTTSGGDRDDQDSDQ